MVRVQPYFSIIIPVFNDPNGLRVTLDSLARSCGQSHDVEILVVDNGSSDATIDVANEFSTSNPGLIKTLQEKTKGSYAARNFGISRAVGEIVCFIDADMRVPDDYIFKMRRMFADREVQYVACAVRTIPAKGVGSIYDAVFGFPIAEYVQRQHFAPTCCLSVRSNLFGVVGQFDARLESGGDYEFGQRVHAAGIPQFYASDIILSHPARTSVRALRIKARRIGRGLAQLCHYYPSRYSAIGAQFKRIQSFMPLPVWSVMRRAKARDLKVSFRTAVAIASLRPFLMYHKFAGFRLESAVLARRHDVRRSPTQY